MSKERSSREEIRDALRTMRNEVQKITRDLAKATEEMVESTRKAVHDVSPKVTATVDETMKDTSAAFRKAMASISSQTRPEQVKLLRGYKSFLSKQADAVDKRLKKLTQ